MSPDRFEQLAARLEKRAASHPTLYRAQLVLLAAFGYAYILFLLLAALVLVGALVVGVFAAHAGVIAVKSIHFIVVILVFVWAIMRSLAVRIPPPEGIVLERARVPRLSTLVEELREAIVAPPVHRIVVTDDFNAALATFPLWGYMGPTRNYLILGLPLMNALGPQHFKAVLAHELGHLSGRHGHFGSWVYRVRQTWSRLHEDLTSRESHARFLIEKFLQWYAPRFNAWSLVLARAQEYQADRYSVEATSAETAGEALIYLALRERIQSDVYVPKVIARAKYESKPPAHFVRDLGAALRQTVPEVPGERWLEAALKLPTVPIDTHPSLADRLRAMAFPMPETPAVFPLPAVLEETAAQHFLGEVEPEVTTALDRDWQEKAQRPWSQQRRENDKARRRMQELEEAATTRVLSPQETIDRALLSMSYAEGERALELLRGAVTEFPQNAILHYALGRLLLDANDANGVEELETAMHFEPETVASACGRIFAWYREHSDVPSCERWRERARTLQQEADQAIQERTFIAPGDRFLPHNLPADRLEHVRALLGRFKTLKSVYLVRKEVRQYPHKPLFVLAVVVGPDTGERTVERIMADIGSFELPGDVFPIFLRGTAEALPVGLLQVPDARILGPTTAS